MARWFARLSWRRGASLAISLTALAPAAFGQTESIRLEYSGAPECPGSEEFVRSVFARTTKARLVEEAAGSRTFVVVLERSETGFTGSLFIREGDETTMARKVTDAKCAAVAEALALATSLAIDPNASLTPNPTPPDETTNPPQTPPKETPPRPPDTGPSESKRHADDGWAWSGALGPAVAIGVGPKVAIGGSASIAWGAQKPAGALSSLGVDLVFLNTLPNAVATASSEFRFYFARPGLCSFGVVLSDGLGVVPCLGVELGAVTGSGSDIAEPSTRTRFWAAVDAGLRLRGDLSERWFLEANADLVAPLVRYRFVFRDPDTHVHSVPPVAAAFGLKLGAWFR